MNRNLLLAIAMLCVIDSYAQSRKITGQILAQDNKPVVGATISVKNTILATAADNDGRFAIDIPEKVPAVLLITSIGYDSIEVEVADKSQVEITMIASAGKLQEIVMIGYGTQRRKDLTGSVASLSLKELEGQPVTRID